jgi:hypothetical protein
MKSQYITLTYRHCKTGEVFRFTAHQNTPFTANGSSAAREHYGDFDFMGF